MHQEIGIKSSSFKIYMSIMGNKYKTTSVNPKSNGRLIDEEPELKRLQGLLKRAVMKETAPEALRLRIQRMIRES